MAMNNENVESAVMKAGEAVEEAVNKRRAKFEKLASKRKFGSIAKHLKSKNPEVRLDALYGLGFCGGEDAINVLTNWSNSEDPKERLESVKALAKCGKDYSITQMRYQLQSETDPEVIDAMKEAMATIRSRIVEKD